MPPEAIMPLQVRPATPADVLKRLDEDRFVKRVVTVAPEVVVDDREVVVGAVSALVVDADDHPRIGQDAVLPVCATGPSDDVPLVAVVGEDLLTVLGDLHEAVVGGDEGVAVG